MYPSHDDEDDDGAVLGYYGTRTRRPAFRIVFSPGPG